MYIYIYIERECVYIYISYRLQEVLFVSLALPNDVVRSNGDVAQKSVDPLLHVILCLLRHLLWLVKLPNVRNVYIGYMYINMYV